MRRIWGGSGFALGLLTVAAVSQAAGQVVPTQAEVKARGYAGLGGGISIPVGDFGDLAKTGWLGQFLAGITFRNGTLGVRVDGNYGQNTYKNADGHERIIGVNASLVVTPGRRPMDVHPYFLGGVGLYNAKFVGTPSSTSATKPALNAGFGIQVHTGHRMDFYVESRIVTVRTAGSKINFVPLSVGLRFGGI